jgi:dTDP-4-dehydrorhamnose 3,5-epimerase
VTLAATSIDGVWIGSPQLHRDDRGYFFEAFKDDPFEEATGRPLTVAQVNTSVSRRGVIRGVHFAEVPPGQAKYVTCARGAVLDIAIDIRVGSPTFGTHVAVQLDDHDRRAIFLAEGIGHAFQALTDDATVTYLCSTPYAPGREHGISPTCPELALPWSADIPPVLSEKDTAAPGLSDARALGLLPSYDDYRRYVAGLRTSTGRLASGQ